MMSGALNAAEIAIYGALADIDDLYQHPPQDTPFPLTIIGDMDVAVPIGGPDDPDRRIPLTIVCMTEGEERQPCLDRMEEVVTRLRGKSFQAEGFTIAAHLQSESASIDETGGGYNGTLNYLVFALAD